MDHPPGPARVPQMCSSQETCGSRNHHQIPQIPGFQSCTTQESNRVAVFLHPASPNYCYSYSSLITTVHLEHRGRGRESGREDLMLMKQACGRVVCPPHSLYTMTVRESLDCTESELLHPFCYLILTFSICTMGDCAQIFLSSLPTLRFFDSKTCYQPTPYHLPSTLINYSSQMQAEVTL